MSRHIRGKPGPSPGRTGGEARDHIAGRWSLRMEMQIDALHAAVCRDRLTELDNPHSAASPRPCYRLITGCSSPALARFGRAHRRAHTDTGQPAGVNYGERGGCMGAGIAMRCCPACPTA